MAVTTIAQIQQFLKAILNESYQGPSVNILDLMQFSSATLVCLEAFPSDINNSLLHLG